jgi:S-adenosylmethionine hydrolase
MITLTTDFGPKDPDGAALLGAVWTEMIRLGFSVPVVDITHAVPPRNHLDAAYIVRLSYHHYPPGTVHVVLVDSAPSADVFPIAYAADGHFFVGMNHGGMALIRPDLPPESLVRLQIPNRTDDVHPAEAVAWAAARLAKGQPLSDLGTPLATWNAMQPVPPRVLTSKTAECYVQFVDHYGNAVTNATRGWLEDLAQGRPIGAIVRGRKVTRWPESLRAAGKPGDLFLRYNRGSYLEIGLAEPDTRANTAASLMGLEANSPISLFFGDATR